MKITVKISIVLLALIILSAGKSPQKTRVVFYNVENLFDTINNPNTNDDEFTPDGRKKYDTERYLRKIDNLAQVLVNAGAGYPEIMGLCEVENKAVVEDLIKNEKLSGGNYGVIHQDSPDGRGIDVAVVYRKDLVEIIEYNYRRFKIPQAERPHTRDLLHVFAKIRGDKKVHFFFNHWPSRWGGQQKSEAKRLKAASELKVFISEQKRKYPKAPVVIMGDLNDYPTNKSVLEVLGADTTLNVNNKTLYNLSYHWQKQGLGTHNYKNKWGVLDHVIVSKKMLKSKKIYTTQSSANIFSQPFMLYKDKDGNLKPNRTYGGSNYYGGYSDHLPISLEIYCR